MSKLQYKTRGMAKPKNMPNIYFCCHPADFAQCFESISDEILNLQNCAVWYADKTEARNEDFLADLGEMQLFVMAVTARLLQTKNVAMDVEFSFAQERHIPVLPLMLESGLEEDFAEKCGDLQYLDKTVRDETAISYEEKLGKYLSSVLVTDELAEKVRAAFDAYVFLSYRKKDRRYARELMRLIHKNDFCRDIAIWYDEFLTPGEDFNESIREALQKSGLFVMTVTPNLVNEHNYIMEKEYPLAKEEGKTILPAELVPTDKEQLAYAYPGIPPCTDARDDVMLRETLLEALRGIAIDENNDDPEHNFFIGLAYLNGIDVEVDHERAVKLITFAAEGGVVEAMKKLVSMYRSGIGVARDYQTALSWRRRVVEAYRTAFEASGKKEDDYRYLYAMAVLADDLYELRQLNEAERTYRETLGASYDAVVAFGTSDATTRLQAQMHSDLGKVYNAMQDMSLALEHQKRALEIREDEYRKTKTVGALRQMAFCHERIGDAHLSCGDLSQALEHYETALKLKRRILKTVESPGHLSDLANSCNNIGDVHLRAGRPDKALPYFQEAYDIRMRLFRNDATGQKSGVAASYDRLGHIHTEMGDHAAALRDYQSALELEREAMQEQGTIAARSNYALGLVRVGESYRLRGDFRTALRYYSEAYDMRKKVIEEAGTYRNSEAFANLCDQIGMLMENFDHLSEALKYYSIALEIRQTWAEKVNTDLALSALAASFGCMGNVYAAMGNYGKAELYYQKQLEHRQQLAQKLGTLPMYRALLIAHTHMGHALEGQNQHDRTLEHYRKAVEIAEQLAENVGTIEVRRLLAGCYSRAGRIYGKLAMIDEALESLNQSLDLRKQLAEEDGTIDARRELADGYAALGLLYQMIAKHAKAAEQHRQALAICEELLRETELPSVIRETVCSCVNVGQHCAMKGKKKEAKEYLERALMLSEQLVEKENTPENRRLLLDSHDSIGTLFQKMHQREPMLMHYRKALELAEGLLAENKNYPAYKAVAGIHFSLGRVSKEPERTQHLTKARDIWASLRKGNPNNVELIAYYWTAKIMLGIKWLLPLIYYTR